MFFIRLPVGTSIPVTVWAATQYPHKIGKSTAFRRIQPLNAIFSGSVYLKRSPSAVGHNLDISQAELGKLWYEWWILVRTSSWLDCCLWIIYLILRKLRWKKGGKKWFQHYYNPYTINNIQYYCWGWIFTYTWSGIPDYYFYDCIIMEFQKCFFFWSSKWHLWSKFIFIFRVKNLL